MKGFAALSGSGAHQHDVAGGFSGARLRLHLVDGVLDEPEDAIKIDGDGGMPLLVGHALDGSIVRWPDAMVGDEDVEAPELAHGGIDQTARGIDGTEVAGNRDTV